MFKLSRPKVLMLLTVPALAIGLGVSAVAATASSAPMEIHHSPAQEGSPALATNAAGKSFGSVSQIDDKGNGPDFIRALATNGQVGYVSSAELKIAEGHPSLFKSPEEALQWQQARGNGVISIPVYAEDGTTKIGQFVLDPSVGRVKDR